ncbi:hypothetical protein I7I48_03228 [Histoplasma ohiense]|nr:hypothetical protein I7I48_03228 [Histoplasma ohiense (nom. inval.)]
MGNSAGVESLNAVRRFGFRLSSFVFRGPATPHILIGRETEFFAGPSIDPVYRDKDKDEERRLFRNRVGRNPL